MRKEGFPVGKLKNKEVQNEEKDSDRQGAQNKDEDRPVPIQAETPPGFLHRVQGQPVILHLVGTVFRREGLVEPGGAPALAADFALAMGTGGKILGIKCQGGPTNLATLGVVDQG